jgi:DNA-binding beta-propeller fold protein YncE
VLALDVAGCVLVLAGGLTGGAPPAGTRLAGDGAGLVRVLPAGGRVLSGPRLPEVNGLASGMGDIWVTGGTATRSHLLFAVNPATSRIVAIVTLPSRLVINPGDVAAGAGAVWVADGASLYRIVPGLSGPRVTRPFATLPDGGLIGDVVAAAGAVWVDDTTHGTVDRYAATTGRLSAAVTIGHTAGAMTAGDGGLWVADPDTHTVSRISLTRNRVNTVVTLPGPPAHLAAAGDSLWVTDGTGRVNAVGPAGRIRTVRVGGQATGLAAAGGSVWVASTATGTLSRINPRRDTVVATIHVGERAYAVAATPQAIWVAVLGQPVMMQTPAPGPAIGNIGWLLRLCG